MLNEYRRVIASRLAESPLRYGLVRSVLALVAGILLAEYGGAWVFVFAFVAALLALVLGRYRGVVATVALFVAIGGFLHVVRGPVGEPPLAELGRSAGFVQVRAALAEMPSPFETSQTKTPRRGRLALDVVAVLCCGRWVGVQSRVLLFHRGLPQGLNYGDMIEVTAAPFRPGPSGVPGLAGTEKMLASRGAVWGLSAGGPCAIRLLAKAKPGPYVLLQRLRAYLVKGLQANLSRRDAGMLASLLLGDRKGLPRSDREAFRRSGTIHILAISGLHLMILVSVLYGILWLLGAGLRTKALTVILFVAFFACLTGLGAPVVRAGLMTSAYFGADLVGRRRSGATALALSAILLLGVDPHALFRPGFQLSYTAVLAIGHLAPRLAKPFLARERLVIALSQGHALGSRARMVFAGAAAVSIAAWAGTGPIVLYHFHVITPVIVPANLVVTPLLLLLLPLGFLSLPLLGIAPAAPAFWGMVLGFPVSLLRGAVSVMAGFTGAHLHLPSPSPWFLALYFVGLAGAVFGHGIVTRRGGLLLVAVAVAAFLSPFFMRPTCENWELVMLDVGQGSCFLLFSPDGKVLVYDAGSRSSQDGGALRLEAYLFNRGCTCVDLLVLSHADADHTNGAVSLAGRFRVGRVVVPGNFEDSPEGAAVARRLRETGLHVERIWAPAELSQMEPARVEVIFPFLVGAGLRSKNDQSLVLRVLLPGGRTLLLTGDLQRRGLSDLFRRVGGLHPGVVAVPHHGSSEPCGNERLARRGPVALVSSDRYFGVRETLACYEKARGRVYWTARDGTVVVRFLPDGSMQVKPCTFRPVKPR